MLSPIPTRASVMHKALAAGAHIQVRAEEMSPFASSDIAAKNMTCSGPLLTQLFHSDRFFKQGEAAVALLENKRENSTCALGCPVLAAPMSCCRWEEALAEQPAGQ